MTGLLAVDENLRMADEESTKEYRWETGYEKTWEAIQEDGHGDVDNSVTDIIHKAKRKRQLEKTGTVRLGMMRHLFVVLDISDSMSTQDLKPTRLLSSTKLLIEFIDEFFYQNPISQLGLIVTKNKRAEKISDLSGNSKKHIKELENLFDSAGPTGEPSLQNSLEMALKSLQNLPTHASREILVIMGSLTTCDPGDIYETIQSLKAEGVRCSVIGLSAELHICKKMAITTGGEHGVVLDDKHYRDQLKAHVDPPPAATRLKAALVKMGFPQSSLSSSGSDSAMSVCMCHVDCRDECTELTDAGYLCPQCFSKHCELPVECKACSLTLVSAPHLARSYHYLFPVLHFEELDSDETHDHCYGCRKKFPDINKKVYKCGSCSHDFCIHCETFIHESLHTCPGCATNPASFQMLPQGE